mmetsp:Transcript_10726/g.48353  ORF Transcript_10726/g.48353 Transcript_10726/m.48353 type:complete len:660 (-) Transcript_10726:221-2200(-)
MSNQARIDDMTMQIKNAHLRVGSGFIQYPPQRPFAQPVQVQPPTLSQNEYPEEWKNVNAKPVAPPQRPPQQQAPPQQQQQQYGGYGYPSQNQPPAQNGYANYGQAPTANGYAQNGYGQYGQAPSANGYAQNGYGNYGQQPPQQPQQTYGGYQQNGYQQNGYQQQPPQQAPPQQQYQHQRPTTAAAPTPGGGIGGAPAMAMPGRRGNIPAPKVAAPHANGAPARARGGRQQQQQQQQQQQHLRQLRNVLSQANVGAAGMPTYDSPLPLDLNGPLMGSQQVRDVLRSAQLLKGAGYNVDGANLAGLDSLGVDVNASLLAMSRHGASSDALTAAAVGALRGAALLSPAASEIPVENRIYVTWRVPSKAIPLRVEDLWSYFSRFGQLAFCNPRPLRNSHAPRRTPSLSGAGYAFLGFSDPGGADAVTRVLERPSHALRGAEIRVKPWRERDEDTGNGDAPAAAVAADVPHAVGDYYFPHPESGLPVLASAAGLAQLAAVSNRSANTQALAMNGMASIGFGLSSNISHRPASDVALDSLGFDETALFGEGFFNIGADDSTTRAKLDNGPTQAAQYMSAQSQLNAATNNGMWGGSGGGMWGGSSGSERSSLESPNASADQASNITFNPSMWQSSAVETSSASDETWTGSRLWNYTGGTAATGSGT